MNNIIRQTQSFILAISFLKIQIHVYPHYVLYLGISSLLLSYDIEHKNRELFIEKDSQAHST